jgi:GT2 family glycosyltransferase
LDLSIIIINWNSATFLRKCLESVYTGTKAIDFEVIIVDNASFDSCARIVQDDFPSAKFIQSPTNLGFAKANNLGAHDAQGRNLLFLNPDTEIVGEALCRMSSFLDATPDAGVVGCRLLNTDMSLQTSCVQPFPSILNQALDAEYLRRTFPNFNLWGMQAILQSDGMPAEVEVVSGACLMIKAEVFKSVGRFSSNYFMYAEDADLCFKVRQTGWKNCYLGRAVVVHHGGGSSGTKPENNFASIMMRESLLEFMRLRRGSVYAAAYQVTTVVMAILRLLVLTVVFLFTWGRYKRELLRRTFAKWVKVLRWGLGMEAWVKQAA